MVYFLDASHFVYGGVIGVLWCALRMFIPTGSGRQRLNVLGAIGYRTGRFVAEVNSTSINKETVCALLRKVAKLHRKPITVVLDNARYQKNAVVRELAQTLGIELLYLPAYSPNLNLIERLWKFVKAKALAARLLPDFAAFQQSIEDTLNQIETTYSPQIESLITRNFQMFSDTQLSA